MRLHQNPGGGGNNRSFNDTWKSYRAGIDATRPEDSPLVWPSAGAGVDECWTTGVPSATDTNPTLGEVRGKVVVLQDFGMSSRGCYGIPYPEAFDIQDNYELSSNWALYGKWQAVRDQLDMASQGNQSTFSVNYLSGAVGSFPYFVASGQSSPGTGAPLLLTGRICRAGSGAWPDFPRVGCVVGLCSIAFEGTNILAAQWLLDHEGRVGVIMADFPGPDLLGGVISQNWNASQGGGKSSVEPPALLL